MDLNTNFNFIDPYTHTYTIIQTISKQTNKQTNKQTMSTLTIPVIHQQHIHATTSLTSMPTHKTTKKQKDLLNYTIHSRLGKGAFAKVYLATHISNPKKLLAIKSMRKSINKNNTVKNELLIHSIASNIEGIIPIHNFIEGKKHYYLIMDYIPNGELFDEIIKYTFLSEAKCKLIIKKLAQVVLNLHKKGIVHRDIKPENILLNKTMQKSEDDDLGIFLADFGLSTILHQGQTAFSPCGTLGYSAPELIKTGLGRYPSGYDNRIDIWAIGCVLYTMLCGFPPFFDDNEFEDAHSRDRIAYKIIHGDYSFIEPWWNDVSNDAKRCVSNLLQIDPDKRWSLEDLLNDPWLKDEESCITSQFQRDDETTLVDSSSSSASSSTTSASTLSTMTVHEFHTKLTENGLFNLPNSNIEKNSTIKDASSLIATTLTYSRKIRHSQKSSMVHSMTTFSPENLSISNSTIARRRFANN
ncbi:hypothetical protein TBLA_0C01320 [Henningerozyma blattae CBS 6284]|uniref:Protein kinase domain-containing protein n=1 Tax=Henningerozyma blattae (strain ATCC 34711 / CBS 6284 / DSM 70876 / NBRC 10599 / NRRL Y-10934 / UCD 77-7) TaxID=1071380 RepID=I2H0P5_HENB6|nr:hypothetical protein TBLA_0C01320 [Tetrapisispora blattae CBS 6284]CCH59947.1 hypothetical protein TBLA_0C01320 [Tetrapisispora blattae CBS 6284]